MFFYTFKQSGCGYIAAIASVDDIECYAVVFVSI